LREKRRGSQVRPLAFSAFSGMLARGRRGPSELFSAGFAAAGPAQLQNQAQGFVHRLLAAKGLPDIRVQQNKICAARLS